MFIQRRRSKRRRANSHCTIIEGFTSEVDPNSIPEKGHTQILPLKREVDPWSGYYISSGIILCVGICSEDPLKHNSWPIYINYSFVLIKPPIY